MLVAICASARYLHVKGKVKQTTYFGYLFTDSDVPDYDRKYIIRAEGICITVIIQVFRVVSAYHPVSVPINKSMMLNILSGSENRILTGIFASIYASGSSLAQVIVPTGENIMLISVILTSDF